MAVPLMFNTVLAQFGINPKNVRLLRHKDHRAEKGRTPYELWRNDAASFDRYQSTQSFRNRGKFGEAKFWAAFVATPAAETLFAGLYKVKYRGPLAKDLAYETRAGILKAGSCDQYSLARIPALEDLVGRLIIDWGAGAKAWLQRADRQNKRVKELRAVFKEPEFPGYLNFTASLSAMENLYPSWVTVLKSNKGIYLLTCPRTREQYVGKADGMLGFWQRWRAYLNDGHGGNVKLKSRQPSDYQLSILEVAGSAASPEDITAMEERWKQKLQTRKMGLNGN
jgi:hypothetical protein